MTTRSKKLLIFRSCAAGLTLLLLAIGWTRLVPIGASILPFLLASTDEGHTIADRPYRIYYNDAGAMHSGNHWTWIVRDIGICRIVVVEGYSTNEVRKGEVPFPARQVGGRTELGFTTGRHNQSRQWVPLP